MFPWHNENCNMEYRYTSQGTYSPKGTRAFWCHTHNQWDYKYPDRIIPEHDPHFTDKFLPVEVKDAAENPSPT